MKRYLILSLIVIIVITLFLINTTISLQSGTSLVDLIIKPGNLTREDHALISQIEPLIYMTQSNAPPLKYYENGQLKGLMIDYIAALSLDLGLPIEAHPLPNDNVYSAISFGLADITDTYDYGDKDDIIYTDPIYQLRGKIVTTDHNIFENTTQLDGKRIAVPLNDYAYHYLRNQQANVSILFVKDFKEAIQALQKGAVDAVIGDEATMYQVVYQMDIRDKVHFSDNVLYQRDTVLALKVEQSYLVEVLNKGIYRLQKNNTIETLQHKWFGLSTSLAKDTTSGQIIVLIQFILLIFVIFSMINYYWNNELNGEVSRQTKALNISKHQLETVINALDEYLVLVDNDGQLINSNAAFKAFSNNQNKRYIWEHMPPIKVLLQNETSDLYDQVFSYNKRDYRLSKRPLEQSQVTLLAIEDITDAQILQRQLLQNNKMIALGQLASGVAHEIRNPLGIIRNYTYILRNQKEDPKISAQAVMQIENEVDRASAIIQNLLGLSRLGKGQPSHVQLDQLIKNIISVNSFTGDQQAAHIATHLEPTSLYVDETLLGQVLINLINNAIDACDSNDRVTIWLKAQPHPVLKIIDTGRGISEPDLQRIFEPFYTTKSPGEGTGLGLYISYTILQKLGIEVSYHSKLGVGTTVTLNMKGDFLGI